MSTTLTTPSRCALLKPDLAVARRHIEWLTGSADMPVCLRLIPNRGSGMDTIVLHGTVTEHWPQIERAQEIGYGVFVVVNDGGDRDNEITRIRALFVDADGKPLPDDWEWHARPDFIVQTRDETHWHAYWRIDDLPVAGFREAQKRLATHYGTDQGVHNPSRVLRLAGTLHLKELAHPRLCTLQEITR